MINPHGSHIIAMRPASGQGGSMAFEDNVVLCRVLKKFLEKDTTTGSSTSLLFKDKLCVEKVLQEYENTRLPRIRTMWIDQWDRAEKSYQNIVPDPWTNEFEEWVYQGI